MPRLILMRHAKSSWGNPGLDDFDRPLNGRGRASARAMGAWLRAEGFLPDQVLCSSSQRTGETFQRLGLDLSASYTRALYHATAEAMLEQLRGATGQVVLMIGHNPGIADFAGRLEENPPKHLRFIDYPTCATLVCDFSGPWSELSWRNGQVVNFAIPREVIEAQKSV